VEKWYFMECTLDSEKESLFKLSKPLFVVYEDGDMKEKMEKSIFGCWRRRRGQCRPHKVRRYHGYTY